MKNRNLCVSLGMLAFSGVLLAQTMTIKVADSRMLPMLSFVLCAFSGAVLLIQSLTGRCKRRDGRIAVCPKGMAGDRRTAGLLGADACAGLLCFRLPDAVGDFAVMAEGWTARTVGRQAALNLAFTACLYVVFVVLLQMVTPSGLII